MVRSSDDPATRSCKEAFELVDEAKPNPGSHVLACEGTSTV